MPVFEKLAGLLSEEADAEVPTEDELESVKVREKPKKATVSLVAEGEKTHVRVGSYFNPHTAAAEEPKEEEKEFATTNLGEKPKEREAIILSEGPLRVRKSVKHKEKKEFEFSPVISLILSSSGGESKLEEKSVAPLPRRSERKNPLGTITSSYCGAGGLGGFGAETQEKIEEKEKLKKGKLPQQEIEKYDPRKEINSVPPEDMVGKALDENGDDLI